MWVGRGGRRSNRYGAGASLLPAACVSRPICAVLSLPFTCGRIGPVGAPVRAVRITSRESGVALMVNRGGFRGHKYWAGRGKIL